MPDPHEYKRSLLLLAAAIGGLSACLETPALPSPDDAEVSCGPLSNAKGRTLRIISITPELVSGKGGDVLTLSTVNGCRAQDLVVSLDGRRAVTGIQSPAPDVFTFQSPVLTRGFDRRRIGVDVTCSFSGDVSRYCFNLGTNGAWTSLMVEALPPEDQMFVDGGHYQPVVKNFAPQTQLLEARNISVLARMVVTFTRPMAKETVTAETFRIDGVAGRHVFKDGDDASGFKTVEFIPDKILAYDTVYTCVVTNAIRSKVMGKALKPGVTPRATADADRWTFGTRAADDAPPFRVEFAAGAGFSEGGGYVNFGLVAPLVPVGEARSSEYVSEAGPMLFDADRWRRSGQ